MNLEQRIRMAAESILENEALREGLYEEQAATALLNWGISRAEEIARATADIEDDEEADEAMYPRMKALRRMLGAVKDIAVAEGWAFEDLQNSLQSAFTQAQAVYGENWRTPEQIGDQTWLVLQNEPASHRIASIHELIEPPQIDPGQIAFSLPEEADEEEADRDNSESVTEKKEEDKGEKNDRFGKHTPI
jgi:CHAD domain-containing protein